MEEKETKQDDDDGYVKVYELYSECVGYDFLHQKQDRKFYFEISLIRTENGKYERNLNFEADSLKSFVRINPGIVRLDVGPVYASSNMDKRFTIGQPSTILFAPWKFDCDLNSVAPNTRECCKDEKTCCAVCWDGLACEIIEACILVCNKFYSCKPRIFFSGGKGFHVWVPAPFLASNVIKSSREYQFEIFSREVCALVDKISIFDKDCTTEPTHLIRMPWSIHNQTGYRVVEIPLEDREMWKYRRIIELASKPSLLCTKE